ncbi:28S ribosomal protein S31, mitochondrial [Morone saxatilis]|uniref:28S ribosomal protein S31, mitochondrial n=1 Tax=Morone saxatilis TaxID=34816 RepID=UPI0015E22697|nr:28S ribosomal protein S31, mitochondrial [Morone saxatilis]
MYRALFRIVSTARNPPASVNESCVLLVKYNTTTAPVFRVANASGVKALSTSSVRLCEKKNDLTSSTQDDKTNADKEADPAESPTLVTQKAEDDSKVIKMAEQSEEPVVLKTDDQGTTQQQTDAKSEQDVLKSKRVKTDADKSGKDNLLDLLRSMSLEVTNKRVLREKQMRQTRPQSPSQQTDVKASSKSGTLDAELVAAASAAAATLPDRSQAESELLAKLRQRKDITEVQKKGDMSKLGAIMGDLKVEKNSRLATRPSSQLADLIQYDDDEGKGYPHNTRITAKLNDSRIRKKVLSENRLKIFSPTTDEDGVETVAQPTLWDMHFAQQLFKLINQPPRNGFDEMIQWTKEGKMWQYPINNEVGLEEEASVSFHEHIFLERHLEEGFPRRGPVRHFMELVVAGLSKNPYLTVQQKREHISWFRDYFKQKEGVLKEAEV